MSGGIVGVSEESEGSFGFGDFFLDRDGASEGVVFDWSGETESGEIGRSVIETMRRGEGKSGGMRRRDEFEKY